MPNVSHFFSPGEKEKILPNFVADVYSLCDALIEQNDKEPFGAFKAESSSSQKVYST